MSLRPYQRHCFNKCVLSFKSGDGGLCVLPTGSGKSHIIGALADFLSNKKVLVVTPRKELVDQNLAKIKGGSQCCTIHKAYYSKIEGDVLIIDEAHLVRLSDGMFQDVINRFSIVFGFTATPFRLDCGNIVPKIFKNKLYEIDKDILIKDNYLVKRKFIPIPTDLIINVKSNTFHSARLLSEASCPKTTACIDYYFSKTKDAFICFCCDIAHAEKAKEVIDKYGKSEILSSVTPKPLRDEIIRDFKKGKLKYLVNCEILTTGFDYPPLKNILLLRPTDSFTLFEQICGRGDRPYPDKTHCNIWDFTINNFNFDCKVKGKTDHMNYCIFCCKETDYRLRKCSYCHKALVKGEPPKKTCIVCQHKNFNCATYCVSCGEFIRTNTYQIKFDKVLFNNTKGCIYFGDDKTKFYSNKGLFEKMVIFLRKDSSYLKHINRSVMAAYDLNKFVVYYKIKDKVPKVIDFKPNIL